MNTSIPSSDRLDRRTALKWMATAAASAALLPRSRAQPAPEPGVSVVTAPMGDGYGTDPDLLRDYAPGDLWPLTFNDHQRRTAAVLCGLIIPADNRSPSAADLKVHDFIDEWISSPYPAQAGDRALILQGLEQLDGLAQKRYGSPFADLRINAQATLCDKLAKMEEMDAATESALSASDREFRQLQRAFRRFRDLTAGGFFTTPEGLKDIGYLGNVPLAAFPAPPADLLKRLGLPVE
ncbi:gluconate 2-dehydrogenase subunit 3 family protein [Synoicihabitans lomoniglobus]|uniref:Gluconate 2-dehydrogenase subunit 3 family protein n=1 Tax=Synoicihabitans lomoniglobus TaxID=2909285 RepID=A0AAF0CP52_9BACT|nr:gluconate 2-dehydrogenase subunit 3 family protein [Opitutaceae bacterium LMO-M01]WED63394.1 gluconate 2-dehydrogenase subunit 3 family protein [Opitutaceae bacterium LMO-M01]